MAPPDGGGEGVQPSIQLGAASSYFSPPDSFPRSGTNLSPINLHSEKGSLAAEGWTPPPRGALEKILPPALRSVLFPRPRSGSELKNTTQTPSPPGFKIRLRPPRGILFCSRDIFHTHTQMLCFYSLHSLPNRRRISNYFNQALILVTGPNQTHTWFLIPGLLPIGFE